MDGEQLLAFIERYYDSDSKLRPEYRYSADGEFAAHLSNSTHADFELP